MGSANKRSNTSSDSFSLSPNLVAVITASSEVFSYSLAAKALNVTNRLVQVNTNNLRFGLMVSQRDSLGSHLKLPFF